MKQIYISTTSFGENSSDPIKMLEDCKYEIKYNELSRKLSEIELIKFAGCATGIIAGTETYSKEVLNKLSSLKVISRLGVGMDNVNLKITGEKGIKVFKTNSNPAQAVAELTLGLIIDVSRGISLQNNNMKNGTWDKKTGNILEGKTLGIIGLGEIGKTLVNLVTGLNLKILAFDIKHDDKYVKGNRVIYCGINEILRKSDIVSLHLNLTNNTRHLMNEQRINFMKPGSILINTSRGEIIDEEALYVVLKNKKLLGAGLDVYNNEPYSGPLTKLENVVLTPHIGSYAKEIRTQMEIEAAENLIKGLNEAK